MDVYELAKSRNYSVVKRNEIVQKARYSLTAQQQKILLFFVSMIKPDDSPETIYKIDIKDICRVCGYDYKTGGRYYGLIRQDIRAIAQIAVWIDMGNNREKLFQWFGEVEIDGNVSELTIGFHPSIREFLFGLKERFTQYSLFYVLAMKSKYSIRLYELLSSVKNIGDLSISLAELRNRIDATEKSYDTFYNFKAKAVDKAVEEINQYSDLSVSYQLQKTGRAFTDIVFYIEQKSDYEQIIANHSANKRLKG